MRNETRFPQKGDVLFKSDNDWHNNACISSYEWSEHGYVQGYKDIADLACENLLNGNGTLDTLVLPICYSYRHYIELSLKGIIYSIYQIEGTEMGVPSHHKIDALWKIVYPAVKRIREDAPKEELKTLGRLIKEFSNLDPNAEEFRYSTTKDKSKKTKWSLEKISLINIRNLYEVMSRVGHLLSSTESAVEEVRDDLLNYQY